MPALQDALGTREGGGEGARVNVPVSTVEKPLTPIDYIAALEQCGDIHTLNRFGAALPRDVVDDDRFAKAFQNRAAELRQS